MKETGGLEPPARRTIAASADELISIPEAARRYPLASVTFHGMKRRGVIASRSGHGADQLYSVRDLERAIAASSRFRIGGRACLVTIPFAAKHSPATERLIRYWIKTRRVQVRGSAHLKLAGGRNGRLVSQKLVSLREIEDELERDRLHCSLREAKHRLEMGCDGVLSFCDAGVLAFERRGTEYEIELAALERLAIELEACETLAEAARRVDLPGWLLEQLIDEGRISEQFAGITGRRLLRLTDVDRLAAELKAERRPCESGCGELALAGRRFCGEHAWAAPQIAEWWERPGAKGAISARLRTFWASEAGRQQKERLSRDRRRRMTLKCDLCGRALERRPSDVQTEYRNVCAECRPHWREALLVASSWKSSQAWPGTRNGYEVFKAVLELGEKLEGAVPKKHGRPRPLKMNLVIEVFFRRGFSEGQITKLINHALATGDLTIAGVVDAVSADYVPTRRRRAKIKR